ncbi:MAG: hypothetical protein JKX72_12695 [Robiginitomaculum sp.]|nr:hypothetical protein [Robiginitomaculum sp.]
MHRAGAPTCPFPPNQLAPYSPNIAHDPDSQTKLAKARMSPSKTANLDPAPRDPVSRALRLLFSANFPLILISAAITYNWLCRWQMTQAAVGLVCTLLVGLCYRRFGTTHPQLSLWLAIWFTGHLLGMFFNMYETSASFDKAMHAIITSGFVMMWIDWVQPALTRSQPDPFRRLCSAVLLAFTFTLASAALWEIFEFAIDQTGLFVAQRGLEDTMLDMIAALAGGALALAMRARALVTQAFPSFAEVRRLR